MRPAEHPKPRRRSAWRTVLILALVLGSGFLAFLRVHHTPRKVADIAGPTGTPNEFQMWYARNGDLTFRPAGGGGAEIRYRDYYGDLDLAAVEWRADDHVLLTTRGGTTFDIRARFTIHRR